MPPNVLLVVLDCVRARNTSLHGYARETTPFLERFTDRSTWYTQARTPGVESLTSHVSMFTGLDVIEHNVTDRDRGLRPGNTIWEALARNHGYRTAVFSANPYLTVLDVGLKSSFEEIYRGSVVYHDALDPRDYVDAGAYRFLRDAVVDGSFLRSLVNGIDVRLRLAYRRHKSGRDTKRREAEEHISRFLAWQKRVRGPWAACINLLDAHAHYFPPEEFNRWADESLVERMFEVDSVIRAFNCGYEPWELLESFMALYDGAIRYLDSRLEHLFQELDARGMLEDTLVVITADHGDGFGEESRIRPNSRIAGHGGPQIHETILHVPLIVKFPGQAEGCRVDEVAALTNFPKAVRRTMGNDWEPDEFVSQKPLIATADPSVEKDDQSCLATDPRFSGTAHAVFEQHGSAVRKHMTWRSEAVTVEIEDTSNVRTVPDADPRDVVEGVIRDSSDAGVRTVGHSELGRGTRRRLQELGYL